MNEPFAVSDEAAWRAAAEAGLGGASFERALVGEAPEGFAIEPLYLRRHRPHHDESVFDRRATQGEPLVAQRYDAVDPLRVQQEIREDLDRGVSALWLSLVPHAQAPERAARALTGVAPSTPVLLDAGEDALRIASHLAALGFRDVRAALDPFAALLEGRLTRPLASVLDEAVTASASLPRVAAVSAAAVVEAGGDLGQAIGFALAGAAEWARVFETRGALDRLAGAVSFVASPGTDVFRGIAQLRALRLACAKLWSALGVDVAPTPIWGVSSRRALSALDAHTNMIRASLEAFSLIAGGADVVAVRAFDDIAANPSALGRRLAKNTAIVLIAESHLAAVADPAKGSFYIESLTDALARAGWAELSRIEKEGGLGASLEKGAFQERVASAREARTKAIARRKRVLVGTSDFGTMAPPLELSSAAATARDAEPFELLRRAADALAARRERPLSVLLLGLGPVSAYRPREAFVRRLFELCGFTVELLADAGALGEAGLEQAVAARAPDVVCVVGPDDAYPQSAELAVASAKRAGAPLIMLAGKTGALAAPLAAAGLTNSVALGDDMVALLGSVLATLGGGT